MISEEQLARWRRWVASRPRRVRRIAQRWPAWQLYTLTTTGQVVSIASYSSNGTVTVRISVEHNSRESFWARGLDPEAEILEVFGVEPTHLEAIRE